MDDFHHHIKVKLANQGQNKGQRQGPGGYRSRWRKRGEAELEIVSFNCELSKTGGLLVYIYNPHQEEFLQVVCGIIKEAASAIFGLDINMGQNMETRIKTMENRKCDSILAISCKPETTGGGGADSTGGRGGPGGRGARGKEGKGPPSKSLLCALRLLADIRTFPISVTTLCRSFPFHMILDHQMMLTQIGDSIRRMLAHDLPRSGPKVSHYFSIVSPNVGWQPEELLRHLNRRFELRCEVRSKMTMAQVGILLIW